MFYSSAMLYSSALLCSSAVLCSSSMFYSIAMLDYVLFECASDACFVLRTLACAA